MNSNRKNIPFWITAYTAFLVILGFGAAVTIYFAPELMYRAISIDFKSIATITGMLAARNAAMGVIALVALFRSNSSFSLALFIGRLVTELQDVIILATTNAAPGLPISVLALVWLVVFIVPELLAIKFLLADK